MFKIYKLKHTLIIIFIILSISSTAIIGIFSNIFINHNFNNYVKNSLNIKKEKILNDLLIIYNQNSETFDPLMVENIGMNALEQGLIIRVLDKSEKEVWDARTHNNGLCDEMLRKMNLNMNKLYSNFKGVYITEKYPIKLNEKTLGELSISYYGPYFYTESEVIFFKTLNTLLVIISILYVLFSILIGYLITSFIDKPLNKVIKSTKLISEGDYGNIIKKENKIKEINELIISINKLSETLAEQENLRKVLTKDIAHELRTPLAVVQGFLEALIDQIWEPTPERLESIYHEILRLTRLTSSLEDLVNYEGENQQLNLEKTNLRDFLRDIVILFEKDLYDKNINYHFEVEENNIYIDKDKMSQAIINIISNSIKYSKHNEDIFIKSFKTKDNIIISIKDTGIGIDEEHIPFIFERFYRVDDSRSRLTGGTGVGLTISKSIITLHKGKIFVKSSKNIGTEFIIILRGE